MKKMRSVEKISSNSIMGQKHSKRSNFGYHEILYIPKHGLKFYLDNTARLFWAVQNGRKNPFSTMPSEFQIPFLVEFIKDHELSERLKFIADPLVCIELYIKGKYVLNGVTPGN